ncbi:MAG: glycosyl hydrolase 115 family protein [Treponema sp.]|nr:glycosyl hydrolase 115 family protein [Treponema sp.]
MNCSNFVFVKEDEAFSGVLKIAEKVCRDVQLVTDKTPEWISAQELDGKASELVDAGKTLVIFGTVGKSCLLDKLGKDGLVDLKAVEGRREVFGFYVLDNKIVIAGSDKRGTIYGLFRISELMGVSPMVDWADVLPVHKDVVDFAEGAFISKEPSVRFRGFFINDEWPATGNWCGHNFGGFNAKMYEHVFELLLRMKGNYLWPAMWSARFSDDGPGLANAELADELGVIMGASHHEPCCRAGEEYRYLRGKDSIYGDAWNFRSNEAGITKFWEDGLKRNGKFENVITVGMRGEADTAIMKNATLKDNIDLLRDVIKTQNRLIRENVCEDVMQVPRMLALYKEVEPYFYGDKKTKGLMDDPELDGVTLMLCDDNHGNLRTVPTEKMRSHKGGYGMYYHFDYHGWPFSYEWVNTTHLAKVKEQMCAAYDFGIQDLWIVNVGDVFTNEFPLSYFLDLAYDYEKYSAESYSIEQWTKEWIVRNFAALSDVQKDDVYFVLNTSTKLAHMRRTECIQPNTFNPVNFGESDKILALAEQVLDKAGKLYAQFVKPSCDAAKNTLGKNSEGIEAGANTNSHNACALNEGAGLFCQVLFAAMGTMNVLRMQIFSGKNKWFAAHGCLVANDYAELVKQCLAYDKILVDEIDKIDGGKFYAEGWSEHFGFQNWCEADSRYPTYTYVEPTRKGRMVFFVEGSEVSTTGQDWTNRNLKLDAFKNPEVTQACVYVANCGQTGAPYETLLKNKNTENDFIAEMKIEKCNLGYGLETVSQLEKIVITIDREKLDKAAVKKDLLTIKANDGHGAGINVFVEIDAEVPDCNYAKGTFVQTGDYISMEAIHFANTQPGIKTSKSTISEWKILPDYGKSFEGAVKPFPVTQSFAKGKDAPFIEYHFVPKTAGVYSFDFFLNPSNPAYKDNKLQFIAEVNGKKLLKDVVEPDFAIGDNQPVWGTDVTNNIRICSVYADCKEGLNVLRIYPVTPNIVLQKIVVYSVNTIMPDSYLGAPETYRV